VIEDLWYKNAIFYSLDCETFYDADGDGMGEFDGLSERLDYVASLGATCVWLQPFYPSPDRDGGHDITDYLAVDPALGDLGKFVRFMEKADTLGLRVILDLVVNHTSREHPWFQRARGDRTSVYRDYYVWADEPAAFSEEQVSFKGEEAAIWSFDPMAGQYYLHKWLHRHPIVGSLSSLERAAGQLGLFFRVAGRGHAGDAFELRRRVRPWLSLSPCGGCAGSGDAG
jgi:maltose alpha-D-glucosyltransferase/alpha-amylase